MSVIRARSRRAAGGSSRRALRPVTLFATALAALGVASLVAVPGVVAAAPPPAAPHAPATAATWTWTNRGPTLGGQVVANTGGSSAPGVSCISPTRCVTVGDEGLVLFTTPGAPGGVTLHWSSVPLSQPDPANPYRLNSVSCSATSCLAVSTNLTDNAQSHVYRSTDGGDTWTDLGLLPLAGTTREGDAIACDSAGHCVIVGGSGGIWHSSNNGLTWVPIAPTVPPHPYFTVSCPGNDACVAAGTDLTQSYTSAIVGGSVTTTVLPSGVVGTIATLGCASGSRTCLATTTGKQTFRTMDLGATWALVGTSPMPIAKLACSSVEHCVGLPPLDVPPAKRVLTTDTGGATWVRHALGTPGMDAPTDLTCSANTCVVVGPHALYATSQTGGNEPWNTINAVPAIGSFALTCEPPMGPARTCLGGGGSDLARSTDSAKLWGATPADIRGLPTLGIVGIGCGAPPACLAIGGTNVLRSLTNGESWNIVAAPWGVSNMPSAAACPSALDCVAVGSAVFTTLNFGLTWTSSTPPGGPALKAVSCPTATRCVALAPATGDVYIGVRPNPAQPAWTWRIVDTQIDPTQTTLADISCPTATFCEIVGNPGVTLRSTDGGLTWSEINVTDPNDDWAAVDCPTTSLCVAGGLEKGTAQGNHLVVGVSNDGGLTWTRQIQQAMGAGGFGLNTVACPSANFCVAGGPSTVLTGSP